MIHTLMSETTLYEALTRLLLAAFLGAGVGVEREYRQKPAGLRTNVLIALGSALFAIASQQFRPPDGSMDRVAAQIVSGVGFLGAGAILHRRDSVQGLTTAATIWLNAAIGMAVGLGLYTIAVAAEIVALIVLLVLPTLERWINRHSGGDFTRE
jgi:putative Mg2+ transporter-C (MgtC) family protein